MLHVTYIYRFDLIRLEKERENKRERARARANAAARSCICSMCYEYIFICHYVSNDNIHLSYMQLLPEHLRSVKRERHRKHHR
jgi:hypothetical protein